MRTICGDSIGARITQIRGDDTRVEFAQKLRVHKNTLARYENGDTSINAEFVSALVDLGYNANWILSGKGAPMLANLNVEAVPPGDSRQLRKVAQAVDNALEELGRTMPTDDKWELIDLLCDMYSESGATPNHANVIRLVRSAS